MSSDLWRGFGLKVREQKVRPIGLNAGATHRRRDMT
jgi:hypothetical protein